MLNSHSMRCLRRLMILGLLSFSLWFLMFDQAVAVKAGDCFYSFYNLHMCETSCQNNYGTCLANYGSNCADSFWNCEQNCAVAHALYGSDCNLTAHSPMIDINFTCEANGDRVYDNCLAGQLGTLWRGKYNDCMVAAGTEGDMTECCEALRTEYLSQGCY